MRFALHHSPKKLFVLIAIVVLLGVGVWSALVYVGAVGYKSLQAESGTLGSCATVVTDTSAAGGSTVKFGPSGGCSAQGGSNPLSSLSKIAWYGGNSYWAQFPDAVKAGWNQPTFFPVGDFWDFWPGGNGADAHAAVQFDKDHGINFYTNGNTDQDACVLKDVGGMSWLGGPGSIQNLDTCGDTVWPGNYLEDEIDGTSGSTSAAFTKLAQVSAQARQDTPNKFLGVNFTSIPIQIWTNDTDGGKFINNYADMVSIDDYLFSTPNRCNSGNPNWWPFIGPQPLSLANCREGQSYGRLTDGLMERDAMDGSYKPVAAFIDIYGGADPAAAIQSSPNDIKAAVVSNLIHGAGFIIWFPLSFWSSCSSNHLMDASVPSCAAPFTAAAGEINNQVKSWAPILNTQSYQYTFGTNLDTMLKWYNGSAYIFAMTDGGTGSRTFTLPSGISNPSSVTDTVSGQTMTVSAGKFTDTFTNTYDYRLYKVTP